MPSKSYECCILGAGPAGLGAALELTRNGIKDILIVDRNAVVGGLSRTEIYHGTRFDIGPHRFYTKNQEINQLWHHLLGDDFKPVERLTRIYYNRRYFNYPIKVFDVLSNLGFAQSLAALLSFGAARLHPRGELLTFEDWITDKFGRKLYETFFKTYTEKVWGIPCHQIGAEWAAQRIKGLDIIQLIRNAMLGNRNRQIKTLVEQFDYPVLGAGQMYEAMCEQAVGRGAELMLNASVTALHLENERIKTIEVETAAGNKTCITGHHFFSSIPLTHLFGMLHPSPPKTLHQSVAALYYRDHITVDLLIDGEGLFPDQWIYIHAPDAQVARIANYNNFSTRMVGHPRQTALSAEYFVFQHEPLWKQSDETLIALATEELHRLKLVDPKAVQSAWVVRETECYPTYYIGFQTHYELLKQHLDRIDNLYQIGRGGMYKYNNQDHSIMSGLLAARNYLQVPGSPFNLWNINEDAEYLESGEKKST